MARGNYASWPGLTYSNARRYCPSSDKTIKGHTVQTHQNIRSTKPKESESDIISHSFKGVGYGKKKVVNDSPEVEEPPPVNDSVNKLDVKVYHRRKLYTDLPGGSPLGREAATNTLWLRITCRVLFLIEPFASRKDKHRIAAYTGIMQRLKDRNLLVDLQILNNECSKEYNATLK